METAVKTKPAEFLIETQETKGIETYTIIRKADGNEVPILVTTDKEELFRLFEALSEWFDDPGLWCGGALLCSKVQEATDGMYSEGYEDGFSEGYAERTYEVEKLLDSLHDLVNEMRHRIEEIGKEI